MSAAIAESLVGMRGSEFVALFVCGGVLLMVGLHVGVGFARWVVRRVRGW